MAFVVAPCAAAGVGFAGAWLSLKVGGPEDTRSAPTQAWLVPTAMILLGIAVVTYVVVVLCPANATLGLESARTRLRSKRHFKIGAALSFVAFESAIVLSTASAPEGSYKERAIVFGVLAGVVAPILGWYFDRSSNQT